MLNSRRGRGTPRPSGDARAPQLCCLPFAHLLGVSKSGTTDLYQRLVMHPRVLASRNKGPHFWDEPLRGARLPAASTRFMSTNMCTRMRHASFSLAVSTNCTESASLFCAECANRLSCPSDPSAPALCPRVKIPPRDRLVLGPSPAASPQPHVRIVPPR
eukprot:4572480-Pleurochrysis_carterae.AAC.3